MAVKHLAFLSPSSHVRCPPVALSGRGRYLASWRDFLIASRSSSVSRCVSFPLLLPPRGGVLCRARVLAFPGVVLAPHWRHEILIERVEVEDEVK